MNNNYQYGGWYDGRQWDGTKLGPVGQVIVGSSPTNNSFQDNLNSLNNNTNDYYNQQQGFYQKNHDIQQGQYDTQNTLALGSQNQGAKDAFLNQVFNPLQKQEGSYQYQYGLDSSHYLNNRDLALQKLAQDEQNSLAQLGLTQGQTNQAKLEELNSRGLLYGQHPTGGYQPTSMGGMTGVAGQQAGLTNQGFDIQRNQIVQPYNNQVAQTNEDYGYNTNTLAANTANNINNQNMNYSANTALGNNALEQYKASLNNQKQQQLYNNEQNAKTQGAMQNGYALYK